MEERERSSIESLGDLQPELRSATGRSEGVQPDKLPFKSTGSEHLDIAKFRATSRPTLIVTPYEALELIKNDYSEKEPRLQLGAVPLVDLFENQELASLRPQDYQKQKDLTFKNFLQNQTVRSLSVIIPVARGRKKALIES